ncbi:MAG: S8 family serine peptidase, partial [Thermoanaerobaculia bacterium]
MTTSRRLPLVLLLAATLLFSSSAFAANEEIDPSLALQITPPGPLKLIVEFHGTPRAVPGARLSAAAYEEIFSRFERDLHLEESSVRAQSATGSRAERRIRRTYSTLFFGAAVTVPAGDLERLRRLPYVRAVHRDTEVKAYANGEVVDARIGVNAQNLGVRGAGIIVAVIDTGIDYNHPALGGGFGPGFKVAGGWDFVDDDADPMDTNGHGTHVAGTVAANAPHLIGVAPDATLLAYRVLGTSGSGEISGVIAAIERAADPNGDGDPSDRAHVINLSLGGPGTAEDAAPRAVDNATAAGIVVCIAAGNDGATASIGSPGVAASAVTVAAVDAEGKIASFSSRGPTPRDFQFKPDLAAPGVAIVSSIPGGGTAAFNGTSMATPHVAGVAALLRQLHPDWSPAEVKGALIAGAKSSEDSPLARGAGRVDAARASAVPVVVDGSGLMFGLQAGTEGTWEATRTIVLRNRSSVTQTLSASATGTVTGIQMSMAPSSITLAPGESKSVAVTMTGDGAQVAFPAEMTLGGDLKFAGATPLSIPWGVVRAARLKITTDFIAEAIVTISEERGLTYRYENDAAELLAPPGSHPWTLIATRSSLESGEEILTMVTAENVMVAGDQALALRLADAKHELRIEGRTPDGSLLRELPGGTSSQFYSLDLRVMYRAPGRPFDLGFSGFPIAVVRSTPLSDHFTILARETYVDLASMQGFHFEARPQVGLSASAATEPSSPYQQARLSWGPRSPRAPLAVCDSWGFSIGPLSVSGSGECVSTTVDGEVTFDYRAMEETTTESFAGLRIDIARTESQTFRAIEGGIVASDEFVPPVVAARIPDGGEAYLAGGEAFPFFFIGTGAVQFSQPVWGLRGGLGELYAEPSLTSWRIYDASGALQHQGVHGPGHNEPVPLPVAGSRFVATRWPLEIAGLRSRGTVEAKFGNDMADLRAP